MKVFGTDLDAAFEVIKKADPGTYAEMERADWWVTTDVQDIPEQWAWDHLSTGGIVLGTTLSPWQTDYPGDWYHLRGHRPLHFYTVMGKDSLSMMSSIMNLDLANYTAAVLVHEFQHTRVSNHFEKGAYTRSCDFARKTGDRALIEAMEDRLQYV